MPRLSVVITAALVILLLLAVALWSRFGEAAGQERSMGFTPVFTVATSSPKNVCVIVECTAPDGSTRQIGWSSLGNARYMSAARLDFPAQGVITVRWAVGKQIAFQNNAGIFPLDTPPSVIGGTVEPGQTVVFFDDPAQTVSTSGSVSLPLTGGTYSLRIDRNTCRVVSSNPPPPPPPLPTTPTNPTPPTTPTPDG